MVLILKLGEGLWDLFIVMGYFLEGGSDRTSSIWVGELGRFKSISFPSYTFTKFYAEQESILLISGF